MAARCDEQQLWFAEAWGWKRTAVWPLVVAVAAFVV